MKQIATHKQSLIDITLQHSGTLDNLVQNAVANGLPIDHVFDDDANVEATGDENPDIKRLLDGTAMITGIKPVTEGSLDNDSPWDDNQTELT
ncbi:MAG: hypothetical protein IKX51_05170 [Bacteroidales bacterium]|nr:hypothetical protein [Bacteroidales bacterium]